MVIFASGERRSATPAGRDPASDIALLRAEGDMPEPLAAQADELGLTPYEQEVLALLAEGASSKLITLWLGISVPTAKFHVCSRLNKFDAIGRIYAVAHASWLGVLQL